jgi:hypothetical protein
MGYVVLINTDIKVDADTTSRVVGEFQYKIKVHKIN